MAPPSVDRLKKTSEVEPEKPLSSTHTTSMLSLASTAIFWPLARPVEFEMFFGGEKTTWACVARADAASKAVRTLMRFTECCMTFLYEDRFMGRLQGLVFTCGGKSWTTHRRKH